MIHLQANVPHRHFRAPARPCQQWHRWFRVQRRSATLFLQSRCGYACGDGEPPARTLIGHNEAFRGF